MGFFWTHFVINFGFNKPARPWYYWLFVNKLALQSEKIKPKLWLLAVVHWPA
jgi:hypothetical protein